MEMRMYRPQSIRHPYAERRDGRARIMPGYQKEVYIQVYPGNRITCRPGWSLSLSFRHEVCCWDMLFSDGIVRY
jgi:hypothetical protein